MIKKSTLGLLNTLDSTSLTTPFTYKTLPLLLTILFPTTWPTTTWLTARLSTTTANTMSLDNSISPMPDYSCTLLTRKPIMPNSQEFLKTILGWLSFSRKWWTRIKINSSKMSVSILNLEVALLKTPKRFLSIWIENMKTLNLIALLNKIFSLELMPMIS